MELIVQKAVELGASAVVPVASRRCVVKLDAKKADNKVKRWQAIAESAAKQSGRALIPTVEPVMDFTSAMKAMKQFDKGLFPMNVRMKFWRTDRQEYLHGSDQSASLND